jgi:hypothetical protein
MQHGLYCIGIVLGGFAIHRDVEFEPSVTLERFLRAPMTMTQKDAIEKLSLL